MSVQHTNYKGLYTSFSWTCVTCIIFMDAYMQAYMHAYKKLKTHKHIIIFLHTYLLIAIQTQIQTQTQTYTHRNRHRDTHCTQTHIDTQTNRHIQTRVRPKLGFVYGFGAKLPNFLVSAWFRLRP